MPYAYDQVTQVRTNITGTYRRRLQTDPTGVEGNAFADEGNGLVLLCSPVVVTREIPLNL